MINNLKSHLHAHLVQIDWYVQYRRAFSMTLIVLQFGINWAMYGRFAVLTAEIGTVLIPSSTWILLVRLFGVVIAIAPVIEAHLGYGRREDVPLDR